MIFSHPKVRRQLDKGEVFTFRTKRRKVEYGEDWATNKRGGHKIGSIYVSYFDEWTTDDGSTSLAEGARNIKNFVERSGFDSLEEWLEVIKELNGGKLPTKGYLYHVRDLSIEL